MRLIAKHSINGAAFKYMQRFVIKMKYRGSRRVDMKPSKRWGLKEEAKRNRIKWHKQSRPSSVCFPSGWWWWVTVARINTCLHGSYISCSTPYPSTGPHKLRTPQQTVCLQARMGIRRVGDEISHAAEKGWTELLKTSFKAFYLSITAVTEGKNNARLYIP